MRTAMLERLASLVPPTRPFGDGSVGRRVDRGRGPKRRPGAMHGVSKSTEVTMDGHLKPWSPLASLK